MGVIRAFIDTPRVFSVQRKLCVYIKKKSKLRRVVRVMAICVRSDTTRLMDPPSLQNYFGLVDFFSINYTKC